MTTVEKTSPTFSGLRTWAFIVRQVSVCGRLLELLVWDSHREARDVVLWFVVTWSGPSCSKVNSNGELVAMTPGTACLIADPDRCWAEEKRRKFLANQAGQADKAYNKKSKWEHEAIRAVIPTHERCTRSEMSLDEIFSCVFFHLLMPENLRRHRQAPLVFLNICWSLVMSFCCWAAMASNPVSWLQLKIFKILIRFFRSYSKSATSWCMYVINRYKQNVNEILHVIRTTNMASHRNILCKNMSGANQTSKS